MGGGGSEALNCGWRPKMANSSRNVGGRTRPKATSTQSDQGCPLACVVKHQKVLPRTDKEPTPASLLPRSPNVTAYDKVGLQQWPVIVEISLITTPGLAWGTQLRFRYSSNSAECPVSSYQWALTVRPYSNSNRRIISVPLRYSLQPIRIHDLLDPTSLFS